VVILGIGNILQKDDGIGVYAAIYLSKNYNFSKDIKIINGGVEGINLYSIFEESNNILILDTIELNDTPGSIYLIFIPIKLKIDSAHWSKSGLVLFFSQRI